MSESTQAAVEREGKLEEARLDGGNACESAGKQARLGEELPIFCEKCGYILHGLPPRKCEQCTLLHLRCPECGHCQPVNSLRPAAQWILGRMRAWLLGLSVFVRISFFLWLLIAWGMMGHEWSDAYLVTYAVGNYRVPTLDMGTIGTFGAFGLGFGMVGRMLLLRWRHAGLVGTVLGCAVTAAVAAGALLRQIEGYRASASAFTPDVAGMMMVGGGTAMLGAMAAWPVWCGLVRLFLPARTAATLLEWQQSLSGDVALLARPAPEVPGNGD